MTRSELQTLIGVRRGLVHAKLCALLAAIFLATAPATGSADACFRLTVVDQADDPIWGAHVELFGNRVHADAYTDKRGFVTVRTNAGTYDVKVQAYQFKSRSIDAVTLSVGTPSDLKVVLATDNTHDEPGLAETPDPSRASGTQPN